MKKSKIVKNLKEIVVKNQDLIVNFMLIFALISLTMPASEWYSNEEDYLGDSWRRFSPDNLTKVSALNDFPDYDYRFLFDYLVILGINHLGFEWTHALGRIVVALLYSASIVTLFRSLKLSTVASFTILLLFLALGQEILGGEWLFRDVEPKTLAYPFVLFSFYASLKRNFTYSHLSLVIATYFHFLVGGFWFLITFLGQLYSTKNLRQTLLDSLKYLIISTPLILIIVVGQLHSQEAVHSIPSASWIYSYFRNPHHVAPFASWEIFEKYWLKGFIFLFLLTFTSLFLYYNSVNKNERVFCKFILFLDLYLIFALIISYFDKNGLLGKFYLFRPSSVILLLTLCLYFLTFKSRFSKKIDLLKFLLSFRKIAPKRIKLINVAAFILITCLIVPNALNHDFIESVFA